MAAKKDIKRPPQGGSKTDARNPKGQRVKVYKNGVKATFEWRPWA